MRQDVQFIIESELKSLKERIIANHIGANQKASGKTIASMKIESTENSSTLYGRSYFGGLETGRKAGKVPKGFYYVILKWAKDKGITTDGSLNTFAYFVAKKIAAEGTALSRKKGRKDIYSNEIPSSVEKIKTGLTDRFTNYVINIQTNK